MEKPPEETFNLKQLRHEAFDTAIIPVTAVSRAADPEACLVHIHPTGPDLGKRTPIGTLPVLIGRDVGCGLPNSHGSVSRRHARVERLPDGKYQVTDLNSTNGTFVNNARVRAAAVNDGDYRRVGECIYRFLAGGNLEAEYHEEIHRLSVIDPLTGIHNRRSLNEFLDREVERAKRHSRPLSVVLFDIDHFKRINDQFGHTAGDFTLRNVAARAQELTRQDELLARYGGEEFVLVLPETALEPALATAERLCRAIAADPFDFEGTPFSVTVSAGVGVLPAGGQTVVTDLLRRADECLYEAKRAGRNCVAPMARVGRPPTPPPEDINDIPTVENGPRRSGAHP
ncbi:MAG TPA: GGDEF domain-containing protein [Gemmataceae bacterium]|nr:GGDEF domain-containing protein [Gemmataceae bacterium]